MQYIILRDTEDVLGDVRPTGVGSPPRKILRADVTTNLSRKEAHDLLRDNSVRALAPSMPLKLIKPLSDSASVGAAGSPPAVSWGVESVGASESPFSGRGVVVAVLDTGIDLNHPAFPKNDMWITTRNFTADEDADTDGHGTHCAGTFFGRDVDDSRIGVARGIQSALIAKVIGRDGSSTATLIQALDWAFLEGARVISMSLGIDYHRFREDLEDEGYEPELATSLVLEAYAANLRYFDLFGESIGRKRRVRRGAVIFAASGNESRRDASPGYIIAATLPSMARGFSAIGALRKSRDQAAQLALAPFSNRGATLGGGGA